MTYQYEKGKERKLMRRPITDISKLDIPVCLIEWGVRSLDAGSHRLRLLSPRLKRLNASEDGCLKSYCRYSAKVVRTKLQASIKEPILKCISIMNLLE